jgi:hypothetical protein
MFLLLSRHSFQPNTTKNTLVSCRSSFDIVCLCSESGKVHFFRLAPNSSSRVNATGIHKEKRFMLKLQLMLFFGAFIGNFHLPAQPIGRNYVVDSDFGDQQGGGYPIASNQWVFLGFWNNVQPIGVQTNWYGPGFPLSLGTSSRPYHIMLDDAPNRPGAVAGNLEGLEYRLIGCDFKYLIYNQSNPDAATEGGKLFVVLAKTELDVAQFDPNQPADFETGGYGQVIFTFDFGYRPGGAMIGATWDSLNGLPESQTGPQRKFARNASPLGLPGDPFQYVGLYWVSEFEESRICIDDFELIDICPDCIMREPLRQSGCMDSSWVTPISNNYYAYTVTIRDSATQDIVYAAQNRPAPFRWNSIGNTGTYTGQPIGFEQPMTVRMDYYSCLMMAPNYRTETYSLVRTAGCRDSVFGGARLLRSSVGLTLHPNPAAAGTPVHLAYPTSLADGASFSCLDAQGRVVQAKQLTSDERGTGMLQWTATGLAGGIYRLLITDATTYYHATIHIQ